MKAKQTQAEAASVVHSTARRWREWEAGDHKMPPAAWELYLLRTQAVIFTEPPALRMAATQGEPSCPRFVS